MRRKDYFDFNIKNIEMSETLGDEWGDGYINQSTHLNERLDWHLSLPYVDLEQLRPPLVSFTNRQKIAKLLSQHNEYSSEHISAQKYKPLS